MDRSFQFFHKVPNKYKPPYKTYKVEVPTFEDCAEAIIMGTELQVRVVYSLVNPKDQYVKKLGRELTSELMYELFSSKSIIKTFVATIYDSQSGKLILKQVDGKMHMLLQLRGPDKKPYLLMIEE